MQRDYTANSAASNISHSIADYNDGLPPALRGVGSASVSSTISEGKNAPGSPSLADGNRGLFSLENCAAPVASEGVAVEQMATPFCNTGSPCTNALVDWQSFTFAEGVAIADILEFLLPDVAPGADAEEEAARGAWVALDRGFYGYKQSYKRGSITVLYDGAPGMGVHVQMSGEGCRQFEQEQGIRDEAGWLAWLKIALDKGARWTKLDTAFDDSGDTKYLDMETIRQSIDNGHVVSLFRKGREVIERRLGRLREGETKAARTGDTIYLGSKELSNMFVRIYNKTLEQLVKMKFEPSAGAELPHWVRLELCARKDNAHELVKQILEHGFKRVAEVLRHYVDFKEENPADLNVSRWETAPWWAGFLADAEARSLGVAPASPSLEKSAAWIRNQGGITLALMVEAGGGALDELVSIVQEGARRFRPIHRAMLTNHLAAFGVGSAARRGGVACGYSVFGLSSRLGGGSFVGAAVAVPPPLVVTFGLGGLFNE